MAQRQEGLVEWGGPRPAIALVEPVEERDVPPHDDGDCHDETEQAIERTSTRPSPVRACDVTVEEPVTFAVQDLITAGDYGLFGGEDGSFKSSSVLHIAGAQAGGYKAFGRFAASEGPSLIVSEEDSAPIIVNRLRAFCRGHGWNERRVLQNIFILAKTEVRLASPECQAQLHALVREHHIKTVIVDPYVEVATGEENSASDGRNDLQFLRSLTNPTGANVVLVHHFGKPAEGKRLKDRFRGTTAITNGSRFTYVVEHDAEAKELTMTCVKLSRGEKLKPFIVRYFIDADPANRAVWRSARLEYVSMGEAAIDHAETFVRAQLESGARLNTTELKDAAKGTGVSGQDIGRALKSLEMRKQIDFVDGPKGSKQWGLVCLPEESRQPRQPENQLAGQPECLPGNHEQQAFCLPTPFRVGRQVEAASDVSATTEGVE